ncbi:MAG: VWA domain-containing protein [Desulfitobacteriaceae bacterium]|nr:VWA domain-containing protein [Desulfitobacteriaceae bacterium]
MVHILQLITALRQALPLSTQDVIETMDARVRFPFLPEKDVLRTLLIHRPEDIPTFDFIWDLLFGDLQSLSSPVTPAHQDEGSSSPGGLGFGRGTGGISLDLGASAAVQSSLALQALALLEALAPLQNEEEALKQLLGELGLYAWLNSQALSYQRGEISSDAWDTAQEEFLALQFALSQVIQAWQIKRENSWDHLVKQHWRYRPLLNLSPAEKRLVQAAIRQWGRTLAVHPGSRFRPSSRGTLDISASLRQAARRDGFIFQPARKTRIPKVPELVVLCDVSNSVAPYVEFLLYLVLKLRSHFRCIRLFLFIDTLFEIQNLPFDPDLSEVDKMIETWAHKGSSGFSDYGRVFREFADTVLPGVSARSTLLILGDGKNNYRPPQTEYLAAIQEKVRRVIWLNPLETDEWWERDNVLTLYREHCTQVFRCRTLDDLQIITRKLLR